MLQKLGNLFHDFCQLPLGFRVISIIVGLGGVFSLGYAFSSGWSAVLPILLILVIVVALFLLVGWLARVLAKRKGKGMGDSLWAMTTRKGGSDDFDSRTDADAARKLRDRWQDVFQLLREKGYDFYSLPWFLIIGPSQSGKTTLIQKSNQEFPIGEKPVADFGTKNCNWFFMNKAIMLDTAGRYVEHHGDEESRVTVEDKQEWNEFLALLLRFRSRSPINGLILVIKIPDILDPDPANRQRTAEILRKALLDIEEQLKIQCPVYIMVSMCDRLTGFTEFFSMLPGLSDRSLLGWSRSTTFDQPCSIDEIDHGLNNVVSLLEKLRLTFLAEKSDQATQNQDTVTELDRLYSFPDEFKAMLAPLVEILKKAYEPSAYHQGQFLRGIYFTSALQKGEPILGSCLNLLGDQAATLAGRELVVDSGSKAFFIADFFAEKVFPEKGLVKLTSKARRERKLKEKLALAAGALAAVATLGWAGYSKVGLRNNVSRAVTALTDVRQQLEKGKDEAKPGTSSAEITVKLIELNTNLKQLQEDAPTLFANNVAGSVRQIHHAAIQTYAYHCFAPALISYFEKGKSARTWAEGLQIGRNLTALLALGQASDNATRDKQALSWDENLKVVVTELDRQTGQKRAGLFTELEKIVGFEALAQNEALAGPFAKFLGCPQVRSLVLTRLQDWVLDPWVSTLDGLTKSPEIISPPWAATLGLRENEAWRLDRLFCLDQGCARAFTQMQTTMAKMARTENWAVTAKYNKEIKQPWQKAHKQFADMLKAGGVRNLDQPITDPEQILEERLERFRAFRGALETLPLFSGNEAGAEAWREVKGSLRHLESRLVKRNEKIRGWVVGDQREHFLIRLTKQAKGKEKVEAPKPKDSGWVVNFAAMPELANDLAAFGQLVLNDIDQDLSPQKSDFWNLPRGIKEWREKKVAIFAKYEKEKADGVNKPLLDPSKVKAIKDGFLNRLDLSFYGKIRRICRDQKEKESFITALGESVHRSEIKKRLGLGWDAFPENGYAFTFSGICQLNSFFYPILQACMSDAPWRTYLDLDSEKDVNEVFQYYLGCFKGFWTESLGRKITAALPGLDGAVDLSGREELKLLCRWQKKYPPKVLLTGVTNLLTYTAQQFPKDEAWHQRLESYSGGYEIWKLYTDQKRQKLVLSKVRDFIRAVGEMDKVLGEIDEEDQLGANKIMARANTLKIQFQALQPFLALPGETSFSDPLVEAFTNFRERFASALGRIGQEIFTAHWPRVGEKAGKLQGCFPFVGKNLPLDDKGQPRLADWLETRKFFSQKDFKILNRTVGDSVVDTPPLFAMTLAKPVRDCFRRCILLARAMEYGKPIMLNVQSGGERSVMHSKWNLQIFKGDQPSPEFSKGFSYQSLTAFEFPILLDKYPRRVLLQAWEGDAGWFSYHPIPPSLQKDPWNFFAWLWLWSEYDHARGRYTLTVRFPTLEEKVAATNGTISPEDWALRIAKKDVPYLRLSIRPSLQLPDAPPDLGMAGWDRGK